MTEMIMPSSSSSSSSSDREGKEISLDQTPNPNQITDLNQVLIFLLLTMGIDAMATALVRKAESGRLNNYKTGRPNFLQEGRIITKPEGRILP